MTAPQVAEQRAPSPVATRLWEATRDRHQAEMQDIARLVMEDAGLSLADGWRFDVGAGVFVRLASS